MCLPETQTRREGEARASGTAHLLGDQEQTSDASSFSLPLDFPPLALVLTHFHPSCDISVPSQQKTRMKRHSHHSPACLHKDKIESSQICSDLLSTFNVLGAEMKSTLEELLRGRRCKYNKILGNGPRPQAF